MESLFGIPIDGLMTTLIIVFFVGALLTAIVALRNKVMFTMAVRNIPRRRAQTVLIVLGLMLATVLFSASFATGDTLAHSIRVQALQDVGLVDERIRSEERDTSGRSAYYDAAYFEQIQEALRDAPVDGIAPALWEILPVVSPQANLSEPRVDVLGIDDTYMDGFDELVTANGDRLSMAALADDEVYVSATLAEGLSLTVGSQVLLFLDNQPIGFTVGGIYVNGGYAIGEQSAMMPLARMQSLVGQPGKIAPIFISNTGDITSGADHTGAVVGDIEILAEELNLTIDEVKKDGLEEADEVGGVFASIFLLFGNFSIISGVLLIFLIFVMLAAERKRELGIARAVGAQRSHIVRLFIFEGAFYALMAAAVGSFLGVGVGIVMVRVIAVAFGELDVDIIFAFRWQSVIIAFTLGMVTTYAVVLISALQVSSLNIVRAIRDIPEPPRDTQSLGRLFRQPFSQVRSGFGLLFRLRVLSGVRTIFLSAPRSFVRFSLAAFAAGYLAVVLGVLLTFAGLGSEQAAPFMLGTSLVIIGTPLMLRHWVNLNDRIAYTAAGAVLVAWWLVPFDLFPELNQGIEMFILSGVMLVVGAVWTVIYNADLLARLITSAFGSSRTLAPVLRTSVAYPLASRFRTGMTLAMFSLVVFTLMVLAFIISGFSAAFSDTDRLSGGFDLRANTSYANPIMDISSAIEEADGLRLDDFESIARLSAVPIAVKQEDTAKDPVDWVLSGVDSGYSDAVTYKMVLRDDQYADDAAVWRALQEEENTVVVASFLVPARTNFQVGGPALDFQMEGFFQDDEELPEVYLEVQDRTGANMQRLRVIGILEGSAFYADTMMASQATVDLLYDRPVPPDRFFMSLKDGVDAEAAKDALKLTFLTNGLRAEVLAEEIQQNGQASVTLNTLLQGFMGLGLVVGIAALGVIAARSVVERRQQIGVLRALGFQRGMVYLAFLLEFSFMSLLGISIGVALGFGVGANVIRELSSEIDGVRFVVPWRTIITVVGIAYGASLLTTFLPARQAANVYPAEALRSME